MMNYIWLSLIVIGILVAVGTDIGEMSSNKYQNGKELKVTIQLPSNATIIEPNKKYDCTITLDAQEYQSAYGISLPNGNIAQKAELLTSSAGQGALGSCAFG